MSTDQFRPKNPPRYPGAEITADEIKGTHLEKRKAVAAIAKTLGFETLEAQGLDRLDFHEVYVLSLRAALEAAYDAGKADALQQAADKLKPAADFINTWLPGVVETVTDARKRMRAREKGEMP